MNWSSSTIVTPTLSCGKELLATAQSLSACARSQGAPRICWTVVSPLEQEAPEVQRLQRFATDVEFRYVYQASSGVYPAMNAALDVCDEAPVVILGAGDILLPQAIAAMQQVGADEAMSGRTGWHTSVSTPGVSQRPGRSRTNPSLGLFRSHQGMIFGPNLIHQRYDEQFPIAADLDMKLRLWKHERIREVEGVIASCLVGGVSDRRPSGSEVRTRARELRCVFRKHFSRAHAEVVSAMHLARLTQRSLGLRRY